MKTRDNQIDTLKGLLIICVHIGHQWIPVGCNYIMQQINNFIYLFHMPCLEVYHSLNILSYLKNIHQC